jgi:hypothetical protein
MVTNVPMEELQRRAAAEVARVLRGEQPRSLVNADAFATR